MLKEQAENERRLTALVSKDEEKHFRIVAVVGNTSCVIVSVLAAFLVAFFVMAVFRVGLIHHFLVETLNRPDLAEPGILVPLTCTVLSAVSMMARGAFKYVRNLGSLEQRDKYRRKRLAHYEKVFEESSHASKGGTSRSALSITNN